MIIIIDTEKLPQHQSELNQIYGSIKGLLEMNTNMLKHGGKATPIEERFPCFCGILQDINNEVDRRKIPDQQTDPGDHHPASSDPIPAASIQQPDSAIQQPLLKTGDTLIAKDACCMNISKRDALTIGNKYEIIYINNFDLTVKDDFGEEHLFSLSKEKDSYWQIYFNLLAESD